MRTLIRGEHLDQFPIDMLGGGAKYRGQYEYE